MRFRLFAFSALLAVARLAPAAAQSLSPYDVTVFGNLTLSNTEVNGRVAVGGNATLSSWSVGQSLPAGYSDYSLVVGGNLHTSGGSVAKGKTYVGGTFTNGGTGFPAGDPPQVGGSDPVNFASEVARLTGISDSYAGMSATGTTLLQWSQLNFIGNAIFNVFTVTIAQLQAGTGGYEFDTPVGATNIVNVVGSSASSAFDNTGFFFDCTAVSNAGSCHGGSNDNTPADVARTLWNFDSQTSLFINGPVHGSILAPNAAVTFGYGDVVGSVVVKSATDNAEFYNNRDFIGTVPTVTTTTVSATPEPTTVGLVATGLLALVGVARGRRRQRKQ